MQKSAQEEFGLSRLLKFPEYRANLPIGAQVAELLKELARWCGAPDNRTQEFDITVIAPAFE